MPTVAIGQAAFYNLSVPEPTTYALLGVGVGDGGGDAPFWTKMVTVDPLAAVLVAAGCCENTVPLAYWAGPLPGWALTAKPAVVRIWLAVCCESPITEGTGTAPPETVIVTVEPGGAVPPLGLWLTTVPAG